jgi:hypothetical protein
VGTAYCSSTTPVTIGFFVLGGRAGKVVYAEKYDRPAVEQPLLFVEREVKCVIVAEMITSYFGSCASFAANETLNFGICVDFGNLLVSINSTSTIALRAPKPRS